jgi:hypothetical protein
MKKIEPISIWDNGTNQNATILNAYCINDNLSTSAAFYYALMSSDKIQLAQGNLTMSGDAYEQWEADSYAWDWIAAQLNLTIIGDWVEPVIPIEEPAIIEPVVAENEITKTDTEI